MNLPQPNGKYEFFYSIVTRAAPFLPFSGSNLTNRLTDRVHSPFSCSISFVGWQAGIYTVGTFECHLRGQADLKLPRTFLPRSIWLCWYESISFRRRRCCWLLRSDSGVKSYTHTVTQSLLYINHIRTHFFLFYHGNAFNL